MVLELTIKKIVGSKKVDLCQPLTFAHVLRLNDHSDPLVRVSLVQQRYVVHQTFDTPVEKLESFVRVRNEGPGDDETVEHLGAHQLL